MNTVYLKPDSNDVLMQLARKVTGYNGKHFKVHAYDAEEYKIAASYWSGGSRTVTHVLKLENLEVATLPNFHPGFDGQVIPESFTWTRGYVVIEYLQGSNYSCIDFYVHPDDWKSYALPVSNDDLTIQERVVLSITGGLKSFARQDEYRRWGMKDSEWETAKESLIQKKLLNKAGAITVDGKNARGDILGSYKVEKEYREYLGTLRDGHFQGGTFEV